ncbi:MAG: TolC family protein [Ginsengibacter sp.]
MKKIIMIPILIFLGKTMTAQQIVGLEDVMEHIKHQSTHLLRFDAEIRSQDEAVKGAYSWMPPEVGTGFWMTPYNLKLTKKGDNGMTGMGQYMISAQQMFPNRKKQNAEASYLAGMSAVTKEKKKAMENDLVAEAKKNYYQWLVDKKKESVISENEKLVDFMIKSAEIRYKNGIGKIDAYYKAKAALGTIHNMQLMLQNDILQKRIALNTLMHRSKTEEFDIDTTFRIKDYSNIILDSISLLNTRSDIKAVGKEKDLFYLEQIFEKAKLKPEFGIEYDHMFGFGGFPMQFTLMAKVKLPMVSWASRANRANIESLKWKALSLEIEQEVATNEALGMAYGMKAESNTRQKQLRIYEGEIIPALKRNFQTVQMAYEQNTEELFVLYDAWEKLNNAQQEYLDLLQQLLTTQAELDRILEVKE